MKQKILLMRFVGVMMRKGVRMKNLRAKKRPVNQPYEVWYTRKSLLNGEPETFQVLKHYQSPENEAKNQYAIVLAAYAGAWEVDEAGHDIYLSDLKVRAKLVWTDNGTEYEKMPEVYAIKQ